MKFDFNTLNFETLDGSSNSTPDIYLNQSGLTFSRKVLEVLGYPAQILCQLDANKHVFAVRACKSSEPKAFKFSKPKEEQKVTVCLTNKNLLDPLRKCTADIWKKDVRYKVTGFWVAEAKTLCFDLSEGIPQNYHNCTVAERQTTKE